MNKLDGSLVLSRLKALVSYSSRAPYRIRFWDLCSLFKDGGETKRLIIIENELMMERQNKNGQEERV